MKTTLAALLMTLTLGGAVACTTTVAVAPPRAGMVLVEGRWVYAPRAGAVWVPGHYERRTAFRRVWIAGHWRY
jgi:YXWGXW repeat-containing protein